MMFPLVSWSRPREGMAELHLPGPGLFGGTEMNGRIFMSLRIIPQNDAFSIVPLWSLQVPLIRRLALSAYLPILTRFTGTWGDVGVGNTGIGLAMLAYQRRERSSETKLVLGLKSFFPIASTRGDMRVAHANIHKLFPLIGAAYESGRLTFTPSLDFAVATWRFYLEVGVGLDMGIDPKVNGDEFRVTLVYYLSCTLLFSRILALPVSVRGRSVAVGLTDDRNDLLLTLGAYYPGKRVRPGLTLYIPIGDLSDRSRIFFSIGAVFLY